MKFIFDIIVCVYVYIYSCYLFIQFCSKYVNFTDQIYGYFYLELLQLFNSLIWGILGKNRLFM